MTHFAVSIVQFVAVVGCIASSVYYLVCLLGAGSFLRARGAGGGAFDFRTGQVRPAKDLPPVSILKPLKGTDPDIYESFRSHCLQDYPEFEIVFGVSDPNDPAIASVQHLQKEFPGRAIHLVIAANQLGANLKVSTLAQMLPTARYGHLIVNDSDIHVERDYLRRVITALVTEEGKGARVGMVTCLYRGVAARTLGSRLESLGISTDFCPSVLVARQLEGGLRFGFGSTLVFRKADLERVGGFNAIVDFLADDYELGRRIASLGLQVRLSDVVVETHLPAYDLRGFWAHQLRWARGLRDSRPGGYFGLVSTFGLMWGLSNLIAAHAAPWSWAVLGAVVLLRLAVALVVGKGALQDSHLFGNLWLLPLRDLSAAAVWIASYLGHSVTWRGDSFILRDGKLIRGSSAHSTEN